MEIATLFTEQKWNILRLLSKSELSPLQMAEMSNTSIANISQQLRLLEASDLVKKHKIKNREKGKPRTLFGLANDYCYIISTMKDFAQKKLVVLEEFDKILLKIFYVDDQELRHSLTKFFFDVEKNLAELDAVCINTYDGQKEMIIVAPNELEKRILGSVPKNLKIMYISEDTALKLKKQSKQPFSDKDDMHVIHDPKGLISGGGTGD